MGTNSHVPVRTPNLEWLSSQGVEFTNAITSSPLCAPARACLASGKKYEKCAVKDNSTDFPIDQPTYYRLLRDEGEYYVAGCGKFDLHKATYYWGSDGSYRLTDLGFTDGIDNADPVAASPVVQEKMEPNPSDKEPYLSFLKRKGLLNDHLDDFKRRREQGEFQTTFPTPLPDYAYCDNWIARNGLEFLDRASEEEPWFLIINFTDPHQPMDVTRRMHNWYRGVQPVDFPPPIDSSKEFTNETHQEIRRNYTAKVENVDRLIGRFLQVLKRRGELDDTVIIYSSDHGEMLGDHGLWKKAEPYHPSVNVPLIMAGPGIRSRGQIDTLVNLIDVAATILTYAGIEVPDEWDAKPLQEVLTGQRSTHREAVYAGLHQWRMVFDGQYKFVTGWDHLDADEVLFDLSTDPNEQTNIADEQREVVERLSHQLTEHSEE